MFVPGEISEESRMQAVRTKPDALTLRVVTAARLVALVSVAAIRLPVDAFPGGREVVLTFIAAHRNPHLGIRAMFFGAPPGRERSTASDPANGST
jgi:hypothetical protein